MKRILLLMIVSFSFTTLSFCQIYQQDFEGEFPEGWTAEGGWNWGNETTNSSEFFTFTESDGSFMAANDDALGANGDASGSLYSEMIDLSAEEPGNYLLGLNYFFGNGDYQGADETAKILYSNDAGETWTEVFEAESTLNDGATAILWNRANIVLTEAGGNIIQLQFTYNDGGGWNFGIGIDNLSINSNNIKFDAALEGIPTARYTAIDGSSEGAAIRIFNNGKEIIETLGLEVMINGEASTTELTGLSIAQFETEDIPLDGLGIDDPIFYEMAITVASINGEMDENPNDNAGSTSFYGVLDSPKRNTVAEEATGTWCTWCPRGAVFMEFMKVTYPDDFVGIAVHNNDPMAFDEYDSGLTGLPGFLGFPSVPMDRVAVIDPSDLEAFHLQNISRTSPASVDFTYEYDEATRLVSVDASVIAHTSLRTDVHRLALVITEDHVTGTGDGYAQVNNYAGGGQGPMGGFENLPNPVPASQMVYEDVARAIVGGFNGSDGSITDAEFGNEVNYTFQYIIPDNVNPHNVSLSVLAIDSETQEALNASKKRMEFVSSVDAPTEISSINIFPNPATSEAFLNIDLNESSDVRISLVNAMGQIVSQNTHYSVNGNQMFPIVRNDLPAGTYMVQIDIEGKVTTNRVTFID